MPEQKRPWFQYHLSTCIVLMFVAGGLIWANACANRPNLGWPQIFYESPQGPPGFDQFAGADGRVWHLEKPTKYSWNEWAFASDTAVMMVSLFIVACICEFLLRRRERRHE